MKPSCPLTNTQMSSSDAAKYAAHPAGEVGHLRERVARKNRRLRILYNAHRKRERKIKDAERSLAVANQAILDLLLGGLDARDNETHGHSRRVSAYAVEIAHRAGVRSATDLRTIDLGALLHDIGKIGIPDAILHKPGKLTPTEWSEMQRHV